MTQCGNDHSPAVDRLLRSTAGAFEQSKQQLYRGKEEEFRVREKQHNSLASEDSNVCETFVAAVAALPVNHTM